MAGPKNLTIGFSAEHQKSKKLSKVQSGCSPFPEDVCLQMACFYFKNRQHPFAIARW